jgi:preprotein translocase subunit SecA
VNVTLGGVAAVDHEEVVERGGLCVLATERFSHARDERVRGWAGRQADLGESRFILCEGDQYRRGINPAAFEQARSYDAVLDEQRRLVYAQRRLVATGVELRQRFRRMIDEVVDEYVSDGPRHRGEDDLRELWRRLKQLYPISIGVGQLVEEAGGQVPGRLAERVKADAQAAYDVRERQVGDEVLRDLERRVLLSVMDRRWREHLIDMHQLEAGIGLRLIGKRDPLAEYRREAMALFEAMAVAVKADSVGYAFNLLVA